SAELVPAPTESDKVRFGCTVTLAPPRGEPRTFRIVGEDEASPAEGRISYVSPLAQSLLGGQVGDVVPFGDGESEIAHIGSWRGRGITRPIGASTIQAETSAGPRRAPGRRRRRAARAASERVPSARLPSG